MEQEIASQVVGLGGVNDFGILQLFLRADFVVKSVIIILLASSVYSWALIFEKYRMFKKINESTKNFEDKFLILEWEFLQNEIHLLLMQHLLFQF